MRYQFPQPLSRIFRHGAGEERAKEIMFSFVFDKAGQATFFGVEGHHCFDKINVNLLFQ